LGNKQDNKDRDKNQKITAWEARKRRKASAATQAGLGHECDSPGLGLAGHMNHMHSKLRHMCARILPHKHPPAESAYTPNSSGRVIKQAQRGSGGGGRGEECKHCLGWNSKPLSFMIIGYFWKVLSCQNRPPRALVTGTTCQYEIFGCCNNQTHNQGTMPSLVVRGCGHLQLGGAELGQRHGFTHQLQLCHCRRHHVADPDRVVAR